MASGLAKSFTKKLEKAKDHAKDVGSKAINSVKGEKLGEESFPKSNQDESSERQQRAQIRIPRTSASITYTPSTSTPSTDDAACLNFKSIGDDAPSQSTTCINIDKPKKSPKKVHAPPIPSSHKNHTVDQQKPETEETVHPPPNSTQKRDKVNRSTRPPPSSQKNDTDDQQKPETEGTVRPPPNSKQKREQVNRPTRSPPPPPSQNKMPKSGEDVKSASSANGAATSPTPQPYATLDSGSGMNVTSGSISSDASDGMEEITCLVGAVKITTEEPEEPTTEEPMEVDDDNEATNISHAVNPAKNSTCESVGSEDENQLVAKPTCEKLSETTVDQTMDRNSFATVKPEGTTDLLPSRQRVIDNVNYQPASIDCNTNDSKSLLTSSNFELESSRNVSTPSQLKSASVSTDGGCDVVPVTRQQFEQDTNDLLSAAGDSSNFENSVEAVGSVMGKSDVDMGGKQSLHNSDVKATPDERSNSDQSENTVLATISSQDDIVALDTRSLKKLLTELNVDPKDEGCQREDMVTKAIDLYLHQLGSKQLKDFLTKRSINTAGIADKNDLIALVKEQRRDSTPHTSTQHTPTENNDGAAGNVVQDESRSNQEAEEDRTKKSNERKEVGDLHSEDDIRSLSVRQLKQILSENAVNTKGVNEKSELIELLKTLWKDHDKKKSAGAEIPYEDQCKICMSEIANTVLLECGHLVVCSQCSHQIKDCPICRQYVTRGIRIFKS